MLMLSGLGASSSDDYECAPDEIYDVYQGCIYAGFASDEYLREEATKEKEEDPWYKDVGKGLVDASLDWLKREAKGDGGKTPARAPRPPAPPAEAWYSTPTGMVGIGVGVIALVVLLRK